MGLEFIGGHRLYDLRVYLHLASGFANAAGLCMTDPYVGLDGQPGSFTSPIAPNSVPLALFASNYSGSKCLCPPHNASVQRVPLRAYNTICDKCGEQQKPRWCDSYLCLSICVPCADNGTLARGSYQSIATIMHDAIHFLDANLTNIKYTIVVPLGRGHSHTILGAHLMPRGAITIQYLPSAHMLKIADFVLRRYLNCNGETNSTFAAMLRLAYGGGKSGKGSALQYEAHCRNMLNRMHHYAAQQAATRCGNPGYLATDVLAQADQWINVSYSRAFMSCWDQGMQISKHNTSWFFIENGMMLSHLSSASAHFQGKVARSRWVQAFLDLSVLASVSKCYVESHMGSIGNAMRLKMGKIPCNA